MIRISGTPNRMHVDTTDGLPHDRNNPNCWCGPTVIRDQTIDITHLDPQLRARIDAGEHIIFDHCRITNHAIDCDCRP